MSFKVIGNNLPPHCRHKPEHLWWRLTTCKCPPPHMTPARGKVATIHKRTYG